MTAAERHHRDVPACEATLDAPKAGLLVLSTGTIPALVWECAVCEWRRTEKRDPPVAEAPAPEIASAPGRP